MAFCYLVNCSSKVEENTRISFRNIKHSLRFISPIHVFINCWNVAGALVRPNAIRLHSWKPIGPNGNAVLCLSFSLISACQYPDLKASLGNTYLLPSSVSLVSSTQGRFVASLMVVLFSFFQIYTNPEWTIRPSG